MEGDQDWRREDIVIARFREKVRSPRDGEISRRIDKYAMGPALSSILLSRKYNEMKSDTPHFSRETTKGPILSCHDIEH